VPFAPDGRSHYGELTSRNVFDPSSPYAPTDPLNPDTDGDGLWDGWNQPMVGGIFYHGEVSHGTDPHSRDTDGDGLSDLYEVKTSYKDSKVKWNIGAPGSSDNRTDPLDDDTDDGGMKDGMEIDLALNPLDPEDDRDFLDTDGDGLLNWEEKRSMDLFFPKTTVDWDGDGRNDHRPDPNDSDTDGDGISDGDEVMVYGTNPMTNDTDGDLLSDWEEIFIHYTNASDQDSDDDLINDHSEVTYYHLDRPSYVDWDGDGQLDNRTDPNNPDTDMDSISDFREAQKQTNPLDPGDPGREYEPEKWTIVKIEKVPDTIFKDPGEVSRAFRVSGSVKSEDGVPLEGARVSILVVEPGIDDKIVRRMDRNPSFVAGTVRTEHGGGFQVSCITTDEMPHGNARIYAVTENLRAMGRLFLADVSDPHDILVATDSEIALDLDPGPFSSGSFVPLNGRLQDIGGLPIANSDILMVAEWGSQLSLITGSEGYFFHGLQMPGGVGTYSLNLSFQGNSYLSPSVKEFSITVSDGPLISLEEISGSVIIGSVININGTIEGAGPLNDQEVLIRITRSEGQRSVEEISVPIRDSAFDHEVMITSSDYDPGRYQIVVIYGSGSGLSVNGSLGFDVKDRSSLVLEDDLLIRGVDELIVIGIYGSGSNPLVDELVRLDFQGSVGIASMEVRSNGTGKVVFRIVPPTGSPLGEYDISATHVLSSDNDLPGDSLDSSIQYTARTSLIDISEEPDEIVLLDSLLMKGRLVSDLGVGVGGGMIDLEMNGEVVLQTGTNDQGFFDITHTIGRFTPLGSGLVTLRFNGNIEYEMSSISWKVRVYSRVTLDLDLYGSSGNRTLQVSIRDERRSPIPGALLQIGTSFDFETYQVDGVGNLTLEMHYLEPGDVINVRYAGDSSLFMLPSRANITLSEENENEREISYLYLLGLVPVLVIALFMFSLARARLRKARGEAASKRVHKAQEKLLYHFTPRPGAQEMVVRTYNELLDKFREKGFGRPPNMTPDEFNEAVTRALDDARYKELGSITRMFDEARYSDHDLSSHLIPKARSIKEMLVKDLDGMILDGEVKEFEKRVSDPPVKVERPTLWKMKEDHGEDLEELIGRKGGGK
ncbi:MAG: DUF4129 domain-containing protein, partial [Candidatus Thermoplasmatota archaeon]|nr:DUF4129 domain-containing protein [Candidatus Thermoplasmatota archaeon]